MCGFNDETKSVQKHLEIKIRTQNQMEKLLLNHHLENHKIAVFQFFDSKLYSNWINFFYKQYDSLKYKKKTRNLEWKDERKKGAPLINIWNDLFLFTDNYSGKEYAVLLVNINLFQNKGALSGTDVLFQLKSLITSTYIVNLTEKLSENNLECLSFLNGESKCSSSESASKNLLFLTENWNNFNFKYETNGGEQYMNFVCNEAKKNNNKDLLNLFRNVTENFKNVSCSLFPRQNDKQFEEILTKTCEFLLNSPNLDIFTKNGREILESLNSLNGKCDIFQHFNLIDDNVSTTEEEFPEPSSVSTSKQTFLDKHAVSKNKRGQQLYDSHDSPRSPKKLKPSIECSDDDEDSENDDEAKNENARACMSISPPINSNISFPRGAYNSSKDSHQSAPFNEVEFKRKKKRNSFKTLNDIKKYLTELPTNIEDNGKIFILSEDIFIIIFKYLNNDDKLSLIFTSKGFIDIFQVSRRILKDFEIKIDIHNIDRLWNHRPIHQIPMINLFFDFEGIERNQKFLLFLSKYKGSIEQLTINNADFKNYNDFFEFLGNIPNLKSLRLEKCKIGFIQNEIFPQFIHLESIYFNKCNDNVFKVLQNQLSLKEISIRNDDWTWNGFPHEVLNQMATNSTKLKKLALIGSGTGNFFDSDEFTFKVEILDTSMFSFHWYDGIKSGRIKFLKSQLGHLKKLTIHQLPFDFDGGKVLKFIIEEMKLDEFYYGKIPLILGGVKQDVKKFEATEIQITSIYEMFCQFPSISTFRFIISATDIASDAIERVINPPTNLFNNLKNFEVIDNSKYMRILGVFLGFFKNMKNLKRLYLKTQDRNINTLLGEFLLFMPKLEEVYITSVGSRAIERLKIIKAFVPNLRKLSVAPELVDEAKNIFNEHYVQILSVNEN